MSKVGVDDIDVTGKRVLVREDFNVPLRDGGIADDRRIRSALPTIESLRSRGAKVIVMTHLGRPKGRRDEALTVAPVASRLGDLLHAPVRLAPDVAGEGAVAMIASLHDGDVGMLENLRFEPGEEADDRSFAKRLASLGDVYVNDAFGTAHRAHASTEGVAHILPAVAGRLMVRELEVLGGVLHNPKRPLMAIIGGAKVSTKIGVVTNLLDLVDVLWLGGAMACTFYRALGESTGTSLVEEDQVETARSLLREATKRRAALKLPPDVVVAAEARDAAETRCVSWRQIPDDVLVVDVGPETVEGMRGDSEHAGTVVWNGPLGIYEIKAFAAGTRAVAEALSRAHADIVIGGGDLAAAVEQAGVADKIGYISSGGGATIEFLQGKTLPGVAVLRERDAARR